MRKIPDVWRRDMVSSLIGLFSDKWFEKYGEFPAWFPTEAPNFENMIMPKHISHDECSHDILIKCVYEQLGEIMIWIYENISGNYGYEYDSGAHIFYFDIKEDALKFKLVWS